MLEPQIFSVFSALIVTLLLAIVVLWHTQVLLYDDDSSSYNYLHASTTQDFTEYLPKKVGNNHLHDAPMESLRMMQSSNQARSLLHYDRLNPHAESTATSLHYKVAPLTKHTGRAYTSMELPLIEPTVITPNGALTKRNVVGSMTTTPRRLQNINGPLGQTLLRLLSFKSLDKVYLNIPWSYGIRKKYGNYTLEPDLLHFLDKANGRLSIVRCHDYGPSTKLLPLLLLPNSELPHNATIITFDDDRLYEETAVLALLELSYKIPEAAVTIASWPIDILSSSGARGKRGGPDFSSRIPSGTEGIQYKKSGPVDLVLGFFGVLYKKNFFSTTNSTGGTVPDSLLFNYSIQPEFLRHCAWVDDIWFSGHLERLQISKHVVGLKANTNADITSLSNENALSLESGVSVKQNHDNVLCAEAMRQEYGIWLSKSSH